MWKCPQPDRARQIGCLDIESDGRCIRKVWGKITYFKESDSNAPSKAEVYCERIKATLREI